MPRPHNPDSEGLRQLPKPIVLDLPPKQQGKKQRRLHEPETDDRHSHYDYAPPDGRSEQTKHHKSEKDEPQKQSTGFYKSAQKAYGQKRPRQPKPEKKKPTRKQAGSQKPRLGQGDRLYNPPQAKEPLIPPGAKRVLRFWALGLIAVAFIVLALMSMLRHNAWAVYVDDRFVGYMPINREVETHTVHEDAVRHLSESLGAQIQVNEETVIDTARARRGEIVAAPEMIVRLSQQFTYRIVGAAIYIDGERIAVLRNESDADHVAAELKRPYVDDETTIDSSFEEGWQIRPALVDQDELDNPSDVIQLLERPVSDVIEHTIRPGDTQGSLAIEFGTTLESLGRLNNITVDDIIRTGSTILIETTRPRLTVRTIEEIRMLEDIPMEIETRENSNMHVSASNIITEGSYGQQEVTKRIMRINGQQVGDPEIVSRRELRAPVTRVIEVGTSETVVQVR
ncbi:MAG: G5 domain-containing protein [Defluviitaleaceae bacterium]|nr:G5 domain-containing protein [Defluviitaleaceae bacterium]